MEDLSQYWIPYTLSTIFYMVISCCVAEWFFFGIFATNYNNLRNSQRLEWISNFSSCINSCLAGLGALAGLTLPLSLDQQFSMVRYIVISITGYSINDTLLRLYHWRKVEKPTFQAFLVFHHVASIFAVQVAVMHKEMLQSKFLFILMELSTVLINIRFMLLDSRVKRGSFLYESLSVMMVVMFFFSRMLPIPFEFYLVPYRCMYLRDICSDEAAFFMGLNSIPYLALTIANFFWFHKMIRGLHIHFSQSNAEKEKIKNEVFD